MEPKSQQIGEFQLEVHRTLEAPADLQELGRRYWKLSGINQENNSPVWLEPVNSLHYEDWGSQPGVVASAGMVASIPNFPCPGCGGTLSLTSRDALRKFLLGQQIRCHSCTPNFEKTLLKVLDPKTLARREQAAANAAARMREFEAKQQLVRDRQEALRLAHPPVADADYTLISDADVVVRIATLALLTNCGGFDPIPSIADASLSLAPDDDRTSDEIASIIGSGLLRCHVSSPLDAFVWETSAEGAETGILTTSYYPVRMKLYAPFDADPVKGAKDLVQMLRASLDLELLDGDEQYELVQLAEELVAAEGLRYFQYQLSRHQLAAVSDPHALRLSAMLLHAAQHFCLGHVYSMAWSAVSAATNQSARVPQMSLKNVTTYAVNSLERKIQWFIDHPSELLEPYDLLDQVKLSAMTRTLYYSVFGVDPRTGEPAKLRQILPRPRDEVLRSTCSVNIETIAKTIELLSESSEVWPPKVFREALASVAAEDAPPCARTCAHTQLRRTAEALLGIYDRITAASGPGPAFAMTMEFLPMLNRPRPEYSGEDRIGDLVMASIADQVRLRRGA